MKYPIDSYTKEFNDILVTFVRIDDKMGFFYLRNGERTGSVTQIDKDYDIDEQISVLELNAKESIENI